MCESLPLGQPLPRRYGNEQLCDECAAGRCATCLAPAGDCECVNCLLEMHLPTPRKADR